MSSGYKGGNYRKYNPSGYRVSSYNRKRRNMQRIRNRIIIVASAVVIFALIIALLGAFFKNCVCAGCASNDGNVIETATINTAETTKATDTTTATKATKKKTPEKKELSFTTPKIKDDGKSKGKNNNGIYVWNNTAFESFNGKDTDAEGYAKAINKFKSQLGKDVTVFSMLVPNHIEMGLPERLKNSKGGIKTVSQAEYIKKAYDKLDKSVVAINCYNALAKHCNEYIYFDSDYRWTSLGAYYGYSAFMEQTSQKPISLKDCKAEKITDFAGIYSYLNVPNDTIQYWDFKYDVLNKITTSGGNVATAYSCYYPAAEDQPNNGKQIVFLQGDYPLEIIRSESKNATENKIAIVHESFSNPMIPYFTNNYKQVYSINMNLWDGDLSKFCKDNKIETVLFVNDVDSSVDAYK